MERCWRYLRASHATASTCRICACGIERRPARRGPTSNRRPSSYLVFEDPLSALPGTVVGPRWDDTTALRGHWPPCFHAVLGCIPCPPLKISFGVLYWSCGEAMRRPIRWSSDGWAHDRLSGGCKYPGPSLSPPLIEAVMAGWSNGLRIRRRADRCRPVPRYDPLSTGLVLGTLVHV